MRFNNMGRRRNNDELCTGKNKNVEAKEGLEAREVESQGRKRKMGRGKSGHIGPKPMTLS